jgi:ubiquinone/menaquinone biosynthesis C-methylase UbiE
MNLGDLKKNWEAFGERDPLWAILTDPSKKNNQWDLGEFFATGEAEVEVLIDAIAAFSEPLKYDVALDFGCGIGRVTQALCRRFKRCVGVDIAQSMISLAREHNRFADHCQYVVNDTDDLRIFEDNRFDLIYCNIVLQHIPPDYSTRYIREFVRVLAPGGLAVFQAPSHLAPNLGRSAIDEMFAAQITVPTSQLSAAPGSPISIVATVKNTSAREWPAHDASKTRYPFRLGNHWLTPLGDMKQINDTRTELTDDLDPGEEVTLSLTVTAPTEPGDYLLELDMVQEHVAWFKDKGSTTCRIPVHVVAPSQQTSIAHPAEPKLPPPPFDATQPEMAMYLLSRRLITDLVAAEGGTVLDIQDYTPPATNFVTYRYYVAK